MQPINQTLLDSVAGDAIRICETPALTGHEKRRARLVQGKLHDLGWTTEIDRVGNLLAYWDKRPDRPLTVMAHLDTVHPDRQIKVSREGDILQGPGIVDNSLGIAGMLYLARMFRGQELPLLLAATVGEESVGNLRGALAITEDWKPREIIALEGVGQDELVVAGPASVRYQIEITGPGGHSWADREKPSATHVLVDLLGRIEGEASCESWNIGSISGGGILSARASQARAGIEFRDHDKGQLLRMEELARELLADLPNDIEASLEALGDRPGGRTEINHPLVAQALHSRKEYGMSLELASVSTDANAGYGAGIPAICFGLVHGENLHTPEEWCSLEGLDRSLDCLVELIAARAAALA